MEKTTCIILYCIRGSVRLSVCLTVCLSGSLLYFVFVTNKRKAYLHVHGWWSGVVVSALASIDEVNLRRARLVLRWATVSGFNSRCRTSILVCNQPATLGQLSLSFPRGW